MRIRTSVPMIFLLGCVALLAVFFCSVAAAQAPPPARALGTIKSIAPNSLVLSLDSGAEITVNLDDGTKILRVAPGEKDLKNAEPISFADLQQGDRILVRGAAGDDGKTIRAGAVIAMKQADIAQKRAREREEWQKHGVGGLVKSVDPAAGVIVITTNASGPSKEITLRVTSKTVLRRYASGSIKFDDARPAPIDQVKLGDQLRARGARSADGGELAAEEIVSGSFRNVAGTIVSVNTSAGVLTVHDLAAREDIQVRITPQAQMRKLPLPLAQRIALRVKGEPAAQDARSVAAQGSPAKAAPTAERGANGDARASGGGGGGGDFQQLISRLPAASLSDLQKGEAVMIVATQASQDGGVTAITLLAGVEPILQASPKGAQDMILSPWSLGGGGAEAGAGADSP